MNITDDRPTKRFSPSSSTSNTSPNEQTDLIPQPTVTIMVESPHEAPANDFTVESKQPVSQRSDPSPTSNTTVIDIDEPIDVNMPRDTTNIFYDYSQIEADATDPVSTTTFIAGHQTIDMESRNDDNEQPTDENLARNNSSS